MNDAFDEMVRVRQYRLGKRAETTAATRRRIVEATLSLHDQQGISGTSVRAIAGRAGVAPATVLQHFPHMDELVRACGELSDQLAPMPTEAIFVGTATVGERIRCLSLALFRWWEQLGDGFDYLRIDRRHMPRVDAWFAVVSGRHRDLADAAFAGADSPKVDLLIALTSVDAWRVLRDAGMDAHRAAEQVAQLFTQAPDPRKAYH